MSKLLIISSTAAELTPLQTFFLCPPFPEFQISTVNRHLDVLITGIGMAAAAFQMGKIPPLKYSALIQAGIAGSFSEQLKLGTVCNVTEDCFSELGAETADGFISADAMNLPMDYKFKLHTPTHLKIPEWKKVKGVTVNTVSGRDASIAALRARFNPDIESMEGASFAMACMHHLALLDGGLLKLQMLLQQKNRIWKLVIHTLGLHLAPAIVLLLCMQMEHSVSRHFRVRKYN